MAVGKDPRGQLDHTWRFDGLSDAFTPQEDRGRAIVDDSDDVLDGADEHEPTRVEPTRVPPPSAAQCRAPDNVFTEAASAAQDLLDARKASREALLARLHSCEEEIASLTRLIELALNVSHQASLSAAPSLDDAHIAAALATLGGKAPLRKIAAALQSSGISIAPHELRKRLVKGAQFMPEGKSWRLTDS